MPGDPRRPIGRCWRRYADSRNAYMPRHIPAQRSPQNVKRIAVLLPFNSTNAEVQKQTQGIYNAIQMALFQVKARRT